MDLVLFFALLVEKCLAFVTDLDILGRLVTAEAVHVKTKTRATVRFGTGGEIKHAFMPYLEDMNRAGVRFVFPTHVSKSSTTSPSSALG